MTRARRFLLLHCAASYLAYWPMAALFFWGQGLTALGYWPPLFSWGMALAPAGVPVVLAGLLVGPFESGADASTALVAAAAAGVCYAVPFWAGRYLLSIRETRASARAAAGRCARCGYDLTGNVSGDCPECGAGMA